MPPVDVNAVVLWNRRLSEAYNVIGLAASAIAVRAAPGQFVMVRPGRGADPLLRRPFSIFQILRDSDGRPIGISLLNKPVGAGTRLIFALEPGDRMACLGPLGHPFTPVDPPTAAWMIAGGVGLAPFAALAEALAERGTEATLFYGARRARDLFYLDFFQRRGVRLSLATDDGSHGDRGPITESLERALRETGAEVPLMLYACGPTGMLRAVAMLAAKHARPCLVSLESVMGCGLGGCYSCVVRMRDGHEQGHYVRSCLEGPVFRSERIIWEDLA